MAVLQSQVSAGSNEFKANRKAHEKAIAEMEKAAQAAEAKVRTHDHTVADLGCLSHPAKT